MESKEQDGLVLKPSLKKPQTDTASPVQAEETLTMRDSTHQSTQVIKSETKQSASPCHAAIGARPFCSPEYSPDFYKMPYSEKKRLQDKQEEIEEVKKLDEWKPAVSIFTAVLEGLDQKAS